MNAYQPIEAITLDLDDTLWPVLPTLIAAEKTLREWLHSNTPATASLLAEQATEIRRALVEGQPENAHNMSWIRAELLREAMRQAGDDPALATEAFELFLAARQQVVFYDEVLDVLSGWADKYPLVAVSNGNADIHRVGLGKLFRGAISAHEQGCAKPDRRMFEAACALSGVPPERTLHIGDDWTLDIQAARAVSMQTAWIKRPDLKHDKAPSESHGEPFFKDISALDKVLHAR
ncbi:MAG: HAD-IA family hydrolase [Burkholderiaceae bacterium]